MCVSVCVYLYTHIHVYLYVLKISMIVSVCDACVVIHATMYMCRLEEKFVELVLSFFHFMQFPKVEVRSGLCGKSLYQLSLPSGLYLVLIHTTFTEIPAVTFCLGSSFIREPCIHLVSNKEKRAECFFSALRKMVLKQSIGKL